MSGVFSLPSLWVWAVLEQCLDLNQSGIWGDEPKGKQSDYFVLRSTNIHDGRLTLDDVAIRSVNPLIAQKYVLRDGDIIVTKSSGSPQLIGKNAIFYQPNDGRVYLFANFTQRLRANPSLIFPDYLYFYLNSRYVDAFLQRMQSTTSGLRNLNMGQYASQQIPLPPLPEQRRIVAILRKADELRQLRSQANTLTKDLLPALFHEMFGDPSSWEYTKLLSSFVTIVGGGTPSRKIDRYFEGSIPWATSKDIKTRYLEDAQEHISEEAKNSSATKLVPSGTILMVVKSKILAHSLPMGITTRPFCFGQDLKGLVCNEGVRPLFVFSALQAQANYLLPQARGVNTEGITLEMLHKIPILNAHIERQTEFTARVLEYDRLEDRQTHSSERAEELFKCLIARAFTGELTAAWRSAHEAELAVAATERDRLLGLAQRRERTVAEQLATEAGQEAFVTEIDFRIAAATQHLLRSLTSAGSLVRTLKHSPFADLSRLLQQAADVNSSFVDAALYHGVARLKENLQQSLAVSLEPLRKAREAWQVWPAEALEPHLQRNLVWAEQIAKLAAEIVRRSNPDHPRYALLRTLGDEQYQTYLAVHGATRYVTVESLAEESSRSPKQIAQDLTFLAKAGLVQVTSVATNPTGDRMVYVPVYRPVNAMDDMRLNDLQRLEEWSG